MSRKDILVKARELIAEDGWVPSTGVTGGPHCAASALSEAGGVEWHNGAIPVPVLAPWRVLKVLWAARSLDTGVSVMRLPEWNDRQRHAGDVLAVFDEAIGKKTEAGLDGPSRTITVEPIEEPVIPRETPAPSEPAEPVERPEKTPEREPEKVPAGA